MKFLAGIALFLSVLLIAPATSWAHSAIFTYNLIDGDNLIMVTHNVQSTEAHVPIKYNVRMYTMDGLPIDFEKVEVRFKHGSRTVNTQTIASQNQEANVTYTYPKMGNYKMQLAFLSHDKQVAQAEASIPVGMGVDDSLASQLLTLPSLLAFLIGAGVTALLYNRRRFVRHSSRKDSK